MISPALLPLLLSTAYFGDLDRPSSRLLDQNFGIGLRPEQLVYSNRHWPSLRDRSLFDIYYRPWAELLRPEMGGGGISAISLDKNGYKIVLDVQQFKPEEIEVKVVDKHIVVEAKHEEKKDEHGLISRQFVRRYVIPENVDPESINSEISSDGVLMVQAAVKEIEENKNVRKIKIEYTGKPALTKEEDKKEAPKEEAPSSTTSSSSSSSPEDIIAEPEE